MGLDTSSDTATLALFLQSWPITSLRTMSIEQYADLSDHDSFCYWLEYRSKNLGEVGGIPLTKFGLWKYKNRKDYDESFESDNTYAWDGKYGKARMQAFKKIISTVAEIAVASSLGDWEKIENINFHAIGKWKIAFLYSYKRLVPVYTREGLLKIAAGLGGRFPEKTKIADLQLFIASKKPSGIDMINFAENLWAHYVKGKSFRDYFIIGSKYNYKDKNGAKDVFPEMLAAKSVAIGFLSGYDLTSLLNSSIAEINSFVSENGKDEEIEIPKLQSYFRILLRLKPGDIFAIKSHGSFGTLTIIAYAVVVERNGKVYEYKPDELGHHINVEYVELGINRKTNLNYAGTLHHVSSDKPDHLKQIFGPFLQVDNIALGEDDGASSFGDDSPKYKIEESYQRGEIASKMVRQLHNIIQNSFFKELNRKFPRQTVMMEYEGRVDIVRENENERWFYEVKPFENVSACLREATGQLIEYAYRFQHPNKLTNLVIIGPGELSREAKGFLDYYIDTIKIPLSYQQHIVPLRQDL
ncbi:MAG: hypothetical protein JST58_15195 [Bacteroidetes bacterium]|nr:hypothetical protein [Bacteroidota bacterium]